MQSGLSAQWLLMGILIFLWGLCGYVTINGNKLETSDFDEWNKVKW